MGDGGSEVAESFLYGPGETLADAGEFRNLFDRSLGKTPYRAEVLEKLLLPLAANTGEFVEDRLLNAPTPKSAVVRQREPVGLVPESLQDPESP